MGPGCSCVVCFAVMLCLTLFERVVLGPWRVKLLGQDCSGAESLEKSRRRKADASCTEREVRMGRPSTKYIHFIKEVLLLFRTGLVARYWPTRFRVIIPTLMSSITLKDFQAMLTLTASCIAVAAPWTVNLTVVVVVLPAEDDVISRPATPTPGTRLARAEEIAVCAWEAF